MKKFAVALILLPVLMLAQAPQQAVQLTQERLFADAWVVQVQLNMAREQIARMQAEIDRLTEENRDLKLKLDGKK